LHYRDRWDVVPEIVADPGTVLSLLTYFPGTKVQILTRRISLGQRCRSCRDWLSVPASGGAGRGGGEIAGQQISELSHAVSTWCRSRTRLEKTENVALSVALGAACLLVGQGADAEHLHQGRLVAHLQKGIQLGVTGEVCQQKLLVYETLSY